MHKSIVIADDSQFARMLIKEAVTDIYADTDFVEFTSGQEVIDFSNTVHNNIDWYLIDINMGKPDGLQVASSLVNQNIPTEQICLITGNKSSFVIDQAQQMGVCLIHKALGPEDIKAFVGRLGDFFSATTEDLTSEQLQLTLDTLAESLNLGLGHVIEELSELSDSRIDLHVPEVNMIPKEEALDRVSKKGVTNDRAIFIKQTFSGDLTGEAILFFSEEESLKLLNGILSKSEDSLIEFAAEEEEMLLDVTNVAVTGVIYALSQVLALSLQTELPQCEHGHFKNIRYNSDIFNGSDNMVLFLAIGFTVVEKDARADLMFFQKKTDLIKLHSCIEKRMSSSH